ncbi:hypothetical protein GCM10023116_23060 [Kistimonas scapharcae]|uniref:Uncharacterized protein n=1 Tax=Kistimonas scapharcae TaxID=1036133 RepID=A0ABP8V1C5_9GAMM
MSFWSTIPCSLSSLCNYSDPGCIVETGDVLFYVTANKKDGGMTIGHTLLAALSNSALVVHSLEESGVISSYLNLTKYSICFRFIGDNSAVVSNQAVQMALSWSRGHYDYMGSDTFEDFSAKTTQVVGYSSARWQTYRGVASAFGTSTFGSGARARLSKYRSRTGNTPKNVICSEMVILAYQLSVDVEDEQSGFINLDAKHSTPGTLASYLYHNPHWQLVGSICMYGD